jgi:AcrR family transcriptional regulator
MTPTRPMRADARRNREKILEAGRTVFAADGPDAQMDAVAARAGVGLGTVYRHFPNKTALATELVAGSVERFAGYGREALELVASPWERFTTMLRRTLEDIENDAGTRHAVTTLDPEMWRAVEPRRVALHDVFREVGAAAQADGSLRADVTPNDIEMVLRGVCVSMGDEPPGLADWRRHLMFVLDGLRADHAAPR